MKRNTAILAILIVACSGFQAASAVTCPMTYAGDWPALADRAVIPSECADAAPGYECKPVCLDGYTSWPDPVLVCGIGGTWTLKDGIGCNPVCPGSPPVTADVQWTNVYDFASGSSPNPAVSCTNRIPEFNAHQRPPDTNIYAFTECVGACTAGFGSPVVRCQQNASTNALEYVVTNACFSAICDGLPPAFTNGTIWPSSCAGSPVGATCAGSCGVGQPSWWGSGNDTDKLPVISCVADASQPTGGRWDTANIVGNCVPICTEVKYIWIRNGTWPDWCVPVQDPDTGEDTRVGGLTAGQVCSGVCQPGFYGTPKWVCNSRGRFKTNRTGDCFPGATGGCFGPVLANVPTNARPWDPKKCWDLRVGWNCTTECNGNWTTTITDPAAIGYGTVDLPYLPHVKCLYNSSDFYNGTYGPMLGKCEPVCRGPLPALANGDWPDNCLPKNGGIGGVSVVNGRCTAMCNPGFSGANGVTPYVTCTGQGWGIIISACQAAPPPPPPDVCAGGVSTPVPSRASPWPVTCANLPAGSTCSTNCVDDPNNATTGSTWGTSQAYAPFVRCQANLTWEARATGTCNRVCVAAPPVLSNGVWDPLCTRVPGGAGGVVSGGVCKGTCTAGNVGIPKTRCTAVGAALAWSAVSGTCVSNTIYPGACEGAPTAAATNANQWPCQDFWVGQTCTAKCNTGGNPLVTYASGSPTLPAPTVSCLYDATSLPYLGRWGTAVTGRCIAVCRAGPPAATGVAWPVSCTPQADGSGGINTGNGICTGSCDTGYIQSGARAPSIVCGGGTWAALFNPCVLNSGRRLRAEGM